MSSYRFCRSDDIPLLVEAYNRCYRIHFSDRAELTADAFKTAIREINLWTSSCMVAMVGNDPIAVLLATKRDTATLIHSVGVRAEHQRQGHGRHLMTSLSAKLAILGPPLLLAEVPEGLPGAAEFVEVCGFGRVTSFTDYTMIPSGPAPSGRELVIPVSYEDLAEGDVLGSLEEAPPRCWQRSARTLANRKDRLQGLAVASEERIEAFLLFEERDEDPERRIVALHAAASERSELWLGLLLRSYAARDSRPIRIAQVHEREISGSLLASCGFRAGRSTLGYEAVAVPG